MNQILSLFIVLVFLEPSVLHAQECQPSADNCSFYSCIEQTAQCGPKGYPLRFGERKCEKYLLAEPESLPEVQDWYRKARVCLQQALGEIVNQDAEPLSCRQIKRAAFESHTKCYVESGYCQLSREAKSQILRTGGLSLLLPSSLRTGLEIRKACRHQKISE